MSNLWEYKMKYQQHVSDVYVFDIMWGNVWIEGRGEGKTCMLIRATDGRGIGGNWREERWNRGTERV